MSIVHWSVVEIKLEGIIFPDVWRISAILKAIEEDTKPAPSYKLGVDLVSEAKARREIRLLGIA